MKMIGNFGFDINTNIETAESSLFLEIDFIKKDGSKELVRFNGTKAIAFNKYIAQRHGYEFIIEGHYKNRTDRLGNALYSRAIFVIDTISLSSNGDEVDLDKVDIENEEKSEDFDYFNEIADEEEGGAE